MSVRRRAVKDRVDRDREWRRQFDATTASLEQLKKDLPQIVAEHRARLEKQMAVPNRLPADRNFFADLGNYRFGFQKSPIVVSGQAYMTRYILYCGWFCLRLHHFYQGDDDRAPHDHPFWFLTFPLASYDEVWDDGSGCLMHRTVRGFRFHFRNAEFRHFVVGRTSHSRRHDPFWTLVMAGRPTREWGFWPSNKQFVPWREWK